MKLSVEQRTHRQLQCVFDHHRLFELFIVLSTFSTFKTDPKDWSSCWTVERRVGRYLMDTGDDWLLHPAAGSFDLWFWGHVMKEIQIKRGAEPRRSRLYLRWISEGPAGSTHRCCRCFLLRITVWRSHHVIAVSLQVELHQTVLSVLMWSAAANVWLIENNGWRCFALCSVRPPFACRSTSERAAVSHHIQRLRSNSQRGVIIFIPTLFPPKPLV